MGKPVRIAVCGALGRMGRAVAEEAANWPGIRIASLVEAPEHPGIGELIGGVAVAADGPAIPGDADVLVDFTRPASAAKHVEACAAAGTGAVVGTTGFSPAETGAIHLAAGRIPLLLSPNMSIGVNLLLRLAGDAARALPGFDVEIVEIHHGGKKDAPSGTAAALAAAVEEARPGLRRAHGREGLTGPRDAAEIGIHSLRGGDVVGEHTLVFAGEGERVELTHRAHSRRTFARGALAAVLFVAGRVPGLYNMRDVLAAAAADTNG
ncbi:MAG: 4-hydroxy-tetrahydrodipicolinate reductase [Candidatus Krumholzibacteriota bacterium]|nr:4-hydroxy-tetrahydrodipicolinate reductase [Candidatus Krumholzibacteriota bacterium]